MQKNEKISFNFEKIETVFFTINFTMTVLTVMSVLALDNL